MLLLAAAVLVLFPIATITLEAPTFTLALDTSTCMATVHPQNSSSSASASTPVPFLQLYNRVADACQSNLEACTSITLLANQSILRVEAAHGYGHVDISFKPGGGGGSSAHSSHILFRIASLDAWHAGAQHFHLRRFVAFLFLPTHALRSSSSLTLDLRPARAAPRLW